MNNTAASQRKRLLARLEAGPISTLEARKELDILAPAPRIWELRHQYGWNIVTRMVVRITEAGHKHRVGLYALIGKSEA